jgi:hypothetical protein
MCVDVEFPAIPIIFPAILTYFSRDSCQESREILVGFAGDFMRIAGNMTAVSLFSASDACLFGYKCVSLQHCCDEKLHKKNMNV